MKAFQGFCVVLLTVVAAPGALAAKHAPNPYAVAPKSFDHLCAINTADFAMLDLKEAGLIDPAKVDNKKTKLRLLLKKSFGGGRYEQVFYMVLHQTDGKSVSIITESTTESDGECPGSGVKTFVVSRELGKWPSLQWVLPPKSSDH